MNYQEFLAHIYQKYSGNVKLELDRMVGLLGDLGHPEAALRGFHIAGTNGKGSVCATLEALALAHGLRTGMNTSPHLIDYTERFRVEGREVGFERILEIFQRHEELFAKWDASFFEITTAIAFLLFQAEKLHTAVIEVGLGGRLDATNLFTPDVCAITTIGLDHVKTLGGTVELIAKEKAGIIKACIPVVLGKIERCPHKVISAVAKQQGAPVYRWGRDFVSEFHQEGRLGLSFDYRFGDYEFKRLEANLLGTHQAINLSLALTAFILYSERRGFSISENAIRSALARVNWKGRMQILSFQPVIIVDGAHNVQGVQALLNTLRHLYPRRKLNFLISILADKNYPEMIRLFCSKARKIYIARNQSERAATAEEQAAVVRQCGVSFVAAASVAEAYQLARSELKSSDVLVCGGSLFTVGEILQVEEVRHLA